MKPPRKRVANSKAPIFIFCGTCRDRRLKCDGGRPACGNCIRRGVKCKGYNTWTLPLVSCSHDAAASQGSTADATLAATSNITSVVPYPCAASQPHPSLRPAPTNEAEQLAAQMIRLPDILPLDGWWLPFVVERLHDNHPELVPAARAVVASTRATGFPSSPSTALRNHIESIKFLRSTTLDSESAVLVIAMMIHYERKSTRELALYKVHSSAVAAILLSSPQKWSQNEIAQVFLHSGYTNTNEEFLLHNKPNPFDQPQWQQREPPRRSLGSPRARRLRQIAHHTWLALPRVLLQLRKFRAASPSASPAAIWKTVLFVNDILSQTDAEAEDAIFQSATQKEPLCQKDRHLISFSYYFPDITDSIAIIFYNTSKLLLLNCLYTLHCLLQDRHAPGPAERQLMQTRLAERAMRVTRLLQCWDDLASLARLASAMVVSTVPIWAFLKDTCWVHGSLPPDELRAWMEWKCQTAWAHWKGVINATRMDAIAEFYAGMESGKPVAKAFGVEELPEEHSSWARPSLDEM